MSGCKEEPTIVIKFEPNDLSGKAPPRDLATVATASEDGGAAVAAKPAPGKGHVAECKQASDCTLVPTGCCGCNNGGKQQAIAKAKEFAQQAAWKTRCAKTMCPMVMSNDPSCAMAPGCIDGQCQLMGGLGLTGTPAKTKTKTKK